MRSKHYRKYEVNHWQTARLLDQQVGWHIIVFHLEKRDRIQVWKTLPILSNDKLRLRMTQDLQVLLRWQPPRKEQTERNHQMEQMTLQIQGGLHPL